LTQEENVTVAVLEARGNLPDPRGLLVYAAMDIAAQEYPKLNSASDKDCMRWVDGEGCKEHEVRV
jgi:hypothetical protein